MVRTSLKTVIDQEQPEPDQHAELSATRHLCAGVYLDAAFRDMVIRTVHNDPRRRVAPSYGFDLVPVVRHAWRAWLLDIALYTAVLACLVTSIVLRRQLAVVLVLCAFAVLMLLHSAGAHLAEFVRLRANAMAKRWSDRPEHDMRLRDSKELDRQKRLVKVEFVAIAVLAMVPVIMTRMLDVPLSDAVAPAAVIAGVLAAVGVSAGVLRQLRLNANQRAYSLRPRRLTRREEAIEIQQNHPCVIYQRPAHKRDIDPLDQLLAQDKPISPFVGTGKLVNRWLPPMTVQLVRPDPVNVRGWAQREHATPPFRAYELVEQLRRALEQLGTDTGRERLPGLQVRDRLYVAESDVPADRKLLDADVDFMLRDVIDDHQKLAHHFLETSVPIAGGELVTTVLIRVSVKGRCLSLDVATCALTRTPPEFHRIDRYKENGASAVLRAAFRAVCHLPKDTLRAWRLIEVPIVAARAWWAMKDRTHRPRRGVQVGARIAVRERAAADWENAQFDQTTIYDHMKIVEQRILKATEDFLRDHDVDTSAFEKQATSIVNSGVLNMGGTTNVNQSAVGTSAQVLLGVAEQMQTTMKEHTA